jgi:hypothetical protein
MGEPRKVFRIEESAGGQRTTRADEGLPAPGYAEIMQELRALRALIMPSPQSVAGGSQRVDVEQLTSALTLVHNVLGGARPEQHVTTGRAPLTHIAHELAAVTKDTEAATQKILAAAEDIDQRRTTSPPRSRTGSTAASPRTSATASCRFSKPAISRISPASASPRS